MGQRLPFDPAAGRGAASSLPALWLELRPTRAIAAQPRVDASAVTLTLGIRGGKPYHLVQTKPDCPFPLSSALSRRFRAVSASAVPIDVPSPPTFIVKQDREAQFAAGRPEDGSGSSMSP